MTPATAIPRSAAAPLAIGYHEAATDGALAVHFQQLWHNRQAPDAHGPVTVLPDGCVDILWRDGRLFVVGPDIVAAQPQLAPDSIVLGARFQPGAAQDWLGLPMDAIVGQAVPLEDVLGAWVRDANLQLADVEDPVQQRALFARLLAQATPRRDDGLRQHAAQVFASLSTGTVGVTEAAAVLEISPRSLLRLCNARFGYGPKVLDRVLRLQRLLSLSRYRPALSLVDLALRAGYADQAHMGRDVRQLAATTPAALCRRYAG